MINRVILIGNSGSEPEVRRLENGAVVAKVSVATNESYKDKSGQWQTSTEWHDVVLWRSLAERIEGTPKGTQLYIEGKLTHRTWQDKDGNNRRTTEVVASYYRALSRREQAENGNSGAYPAQSIPESKGDANFIDGTPGTQHDPATAEEDDLPF